MLQEQRKRVMLHVTDAGSHWRQSDEPNLEDPERGMEGSAFLSEPTEASEIVRPSVFGSKAMCVCVCPACVHAAQSFEMDS